MVRNIVIILIGLHALFRRVKCLKVKVCQVSFALDQNLCRYLKESQTVFKWQLAHVGHIKAIEVTTVGLESKSFEYRGIEWGARATEPAEFKLLQTTLRDIERL